MSRDKEQQAIGEQGSRTDQDSQAGSDPNHVQFVIPSHSPQISSPGLRKRTTILVGIAFVLLGLLMMFIAGDSAAGIVSALSSDASGNANDLLTFETGELH